LIMPNFEYCCDNLFEKGNIVNLNTNMSVSKHHHAFKYLLEKSGENFDYMMISFHPQAEEKEDQFFEKLALLREAGHYIICKLVAHPGRMHLLEHLDQRCREIDVCFFPASLTSKIYPQNYTEEEKATLRKYFSSLSQNIQLFSGVDVNGMKCRAGSNLICIDMESGKIRPCINIPKPYIGDFYKDELELYSGPISCPWERKQCSCYTHFQQDIVIGAEDNHNFDKQKRGYVEYIPVEEQDRMMRDLNLKFCDVPPLQGQVMDNDSLIIERSSLRGRLESYMAEQAKSRYFSTRVKRKLMSVYNRLKG